jgi:hypothetical protein
VSAAKIDRENLKEFNRVTYHKFQTPANNVSAVFFSFFDANVEPTARIPQCSLGLIYVPHRTCPHCQTFSVSRALFLTNPGAHCLHAFLHDDRHIQRGLLPRLCLADLVLVRIRLHLSHGRSARVTSSTTKATHQRCCHRRSYRKCFPMAPHTVGHCPTQQPPRNRLGP